MGVDNNTFPKIVDVDAIWVFIDANFAFSLQVYKSAIVERLKLRD
jgi:hypothetical protein